MSDTYKGSSLQHWLWRCWINKQNIDCKRALRIMDRTTPLTYGPFESWI